MYSLLIVVQRTLIVSTTTAPPRHRHHHRATKVIILLHVMGKCKGCWDIYFCFYVNSILYLPWINNYFPHNRSNMTVNDHKNLVEYGILLVSDGWKWGQRIAHFWLFIFRVFPNNSKTKDRSKKTFCMYLYEQPL